MKQKKHVVIFGSTFGYMKNIHHLPHNKDFLKFPALEQAASLLQYLKAEVATFKAKNPDWKGFYSRDSDQTELDDIQEQIGIAEDELSNKDYLNFSLSMYCIGISLGTINYMEAVHGQINTARNLTVGRPRGTEKTKKKAEDRSLAIRAFAIDYFKKNPARNNTDAIAAMRNSASKHLSEIASRYKKGSLEKIISGCKNIALEQISESGLA